MSTLEPSEIPYPRTDGTQPCAGEDLAVFFPHQRQVALHHSTAGPEGPTWRDVAPGTREAYRQIEFALSICSTCPFQRPCLAYALTHDVEGIWGGTTHLARRDLRAQHHITAVPVDLPETAVQAIDVDRFDRGGLPPPRSPEPPG